MTTWVGGIVTDLGNEVTGEEIDLAFHPDQPRDAHGRWTRTGMGDTVGPRHALEDVVGPRHPQPPPDDFMHRQRATRTQLVAASQRRIMQALTMDPAKMSDDQIFTASQVISSLAPHDYDDIRKLTHEVVPRHIADHVTNRVADLATGIKDEANHDAKAKLITHLAVILGALALSFITAGLGAPAGLAALIGISPYLVQEFRDFRTDRKVEPIIARAS